MTHKNDLNFNAKFNSKDKFGFRKLSVGLVTVALGTTFFLSNGQLVHADEITNQNTASTEIKGNPNDQKANDVKTIDTNDSSNTTNIVKAEITTATSDSSETDSNNDKKDEETSTLDTSSLRNKDNSQIAASLTESKVSTNTPSYSSNVTAQKRNADGTSTNVTNTTQQMAADQDAIEVDTTVDLTGVKKVTHDNPITVQIVNSDTGAADTLKTNDKITGNNNWHFEKLTDIENAFNAWYTGTDLPTSVTFRINVQASNTKVKDYLAKHTDESSENIPVGVKITYPTGKIETQHAFDANFIPSQDKIDHAEILKGFRIGETTLEDEVHYGNISTEDIKNYDLDPNKSELHVLQWGFYFNYSNNLNPNDITTLKNAIFSATFNDQVYIPDSIKIFEVPAKWVSDGHGNRYGIDDIPAGESNNVYHLITDGNTQYESKDFENYLKANSTSAGFSVNQTKSENDIIFYVPNSNGQKDISYSKKAYFIQVDTVVKQPIGNQIWLDTHNQSFQGEGTTSYDHRVVWLSNTTGDGSDSQYTQQAIIRYYDDDSKQFLNIDNNHSSDVSVNGHAGETIDFGINAKNNYDHFINANYEYTKITIDTENGNSILDINRNPEAFATTGIFPQFDNENNNTDGTDSHPQYFVVHFTHKKSQAHETTTVTENISYYYENGSKQGNAVPSQYVPINHELHFVRDGQTDLVTGNTTWGQWTLTNTNNNVFPAISFNDLPQVLDDNYKLNPNGSFIIIDSTGKDETEQLLIIKGVNGGIRAIPFSNDEITALYNQNGGSITIQVPYIQVSQPTSTPIKPPTTNPQPTQPSPSQPTQQPSAPTPIQPTISVAPQPTAPIQPTIAPVQPEITPVRPTKNKKVGTTDTTVTPHGQNVKTKNSRNYKYTLSPKATTIHTIQTKSQTKITASRTANNHKTGTLPQTGESKTNLSLLGLGFITIASLIGLAIDRKRKN